MEWLPWTEYTPDIRALAAELEGKQGLLGRPDEPPGLEAYLVRLAHDLRNQISVHHLRLHIAARSRDASPGRIALR